MAELISDSRSGRQHKRANQYDSTDHNYMLYWNERQYEHFAEEIAIKRLLKGRHFKLAVDVGGGYGRLSRLLTFYADKVILTDPSKRQLDFAANYLKEYPAIDRQLMQADDLKFKNGSVDLAVVVRVFHHIPSPQPELLEIARILSNDGYAVIEVANYSHFLNRLKYLLKLKKLPIKPIDIRSPSNRQKDQIPFVNHNPNTFIRQLSLSGLKVEKVLSVSNLRSSALKKNIPTTLLLKTEAAVQGPLSHIYFGPSIFFLVKKSTPKT